MILTVLYDNTSSRAELSPDWGFACHVGGLEKAILFDTGARGDVLLQNMRRLGVEPGEIDLVVLSHDHWDHTGGLADFLERNSNVEVFLPAAFPQELKDAVSRAGARVTETNGPVRLCEGAGTSGVIAQPVVEQALCLETADGLVVVTGCAHPGVVELAEAAKRAWGGELDAVLGGFHLASASEQGLSRVIASLKALGVRRVGPCHCSGERAMAMMREAFGEGYVHLAVGAREDFPAAWSAGD